MVVMELMFIYENAQNVNMVSLEFHFNFIGDNGYKC